MASQETLRHSLDLFHSKTRRVLLWMNLSKEPFVVLYALMPFLLRKDLGASLFQISLLTALRPVVPLFSFYWSANLTNRKHLLRSNLIGAWVLGRVPFLFVPWFDNVWYIIFCCGVYEFFNKSGIPALIEILNINIPKEAREKTYTFYFVLSFVESIALGFCMGGILDWHESAWKVVCCLTTLIGLSSLLVQLRLPIPLDSLSPPPKELSSFKTKLVKPWIEALALLKARPDFAKFQYGFMMGGFGLMFIAPSLSVLYVDKLNLAHSQVITGRSILMGVGIVLSSFFWRKSLSTLKPGHLTSKVLFGFGLFPLALALAIFNLKWFYLAFILYGVAQAGSHLLWNLSGTLFASKDQDSSAFSRVNILMLGLRGLIAPALGGYVCQKLGPVTVLLAGASMCLIGAYYMKQTPLSQSFRVRF